MRVREDEECDEQDGDSEERELVAAAFTPVEGGEKWKHKWDGVWEKAVEVQEVRKYLRGKADSSSPGPSLMRYGLYPGSKVGHAALKFLAVLICLALLCAGSGLSAVHMINPCAVASC